MLTQPETRKLEGYFKRKGIEIPQSAKKIIERYENDELAGNLVFEQALQVALSTAGIQVFMPLNQSLGFYAVVPDAVWVEQMVKAGAPTVQLRMKDARLEVVRREVRQAVEAVKGSATRLFVNDYWEEAAQWGAYGAHLGQEDVRKVDIRAVRESGLRLGVSTHSHEELAYALALHPSYVASGAIYPTTTKVMPTAPQGIEKLRDYVKAAQPTPVVAIGGINLQNAALVLSTGVASIAAVRAVTKAQDPIATVAMFNRLFA